MAASSFPSPLAAALATDGELALELAAIYEAAGSPWAVPAYVLDMRVGGVRVGSISLRVSDAERIRLHAGHIGFSVEPPWRGRGLAGRAVRLLLPLAQAHGLDPLWLTCDPGNFASRRAIERLGAEYAGTVPLPASYDAYRRGERHKRRYRLALGTTGAATPAPAQPLSSPPAWRPARRARTPGWRRQSARPRR
jgi:predicted acetyltransferase